MPPHVLVAFDESDQSTAALEHALTRFPEAAVTVVHVNNPTEWATFDEEGAFYSERTYEEVQESAERVLEEARAIAADHGREVDTDLLTGRPALEIVAYAEDHDVDHVVVGSHGRRGLARFLLGSVAEQVVRRSPAPVTVMRGAAED